MDDRNSRPVCNSNNLLYYQRMKELINNWGIWWDVSVIVLAIIATVVWLDIVVGNRIRTNATSLIGMLTQDVMNKYVKTKKIMKAKLLHNAFGRMYAVVNIDGHYVVIGSYQRRRFNKLLKKHHSKLTFKQVMENAVYYAKK